MASTGVYIPDNSPLMRKIREKADRNHGGKISAYLRQLAEKDTSGEGVNDTPLASLLTDICRRLLPGHAAHLQEILADLKVNEPELMSRLLSALIDSLDETKRQRDSGMVNESQAHYAATGRGGMEIILAPNGGSRTGASTSHNTAANPARAGKKRTPGS